MDENSKQAILSATKELLEQMIEANDIKEKDVAFAMFTTTPDLNAEFPAVAARQLGWEESALLCGHEMSVPGALARCIRILVMVNTEKSLDQINHVYTRGAVSLRPRFAKANSDQHAR